MKKSLIYIIVLFFVGVFFTPCALAVPSKKVDVLFLGDASSGKTWLRARLLHAEDPDLFARSYRDHTRQVNYIADSMLIGSKIATLLYWDSPGDTTVRKQLLTLAIKDVPFIVLTMDLPKHTFDEKEHKGVDVVSGCLNDWLGTIFASEHCRNTYVIIAGTKSDVTEPAQRDQVECAVKALITNLPSYKGRCEYICTSALDNKPPYLVKQIEDIIERRIKSGAVDLDSLPDYSGSSDAKVSLPGCDKPIFEKIPDYTSTLPCLVM